MGHARLLLALIIMAGHLSPIGAEWAATAMIGFYVLSGSSITARGTKGDFWVGRVLRLWPCYLVVLVATQWALWLGWGSNIPYVAMPQGWYQFLQYFMIVPTWPQVSLVPIAWMIKWLLAGYLLMWMGVSKTPQRSAVWLLISLFFSTFYLFKLNQYLPYYQSFWCASLATAAGACCHHLGIVAARDHGLAALAGAISYPVFLLHWLVAGAAIGLLGLGVPSWPLFFASLAPTLLLSWLLVVAVEQPVDRYRKRLRS